MAISKQKFFKIYSLVAADQMAMKISTLEVLYNNNEKFVSEYLQAETQKEVDKINERGVENIPEDDLHELTTSINNYYGLTHETQEVLSHYMVVATFSFYEKALKKVLQLTDKLTAQELKNCYKKDSLTKTLRDRFSISYSDLPCSNGIEELRCLNNDIKHNGIVGSELAAANAKWILDAEIDNTYIDFTRLKEDPRNLLYALSAQLESHI